TGRFGLLHAPTGLSGCGTLLVFPDTPNGPGDTPCVSGRWITGDLRHENIGPDSGNAVRSLDPLLWMRTPCGSLFYAAGNENVFLGDCSCRKPLVIGGIGCFW